MSLKAAILNELYNKAKANRLVLNKGEFAEKLGFSRSFLHKLMTGLEEVSDDVIEDAKKITTNTKNVSENTNQVSAQLVSEPPTSYDVAQKNSDNMYLEVILNLTAANQEAINNCSRLVALLEKKLLPTAGAGVESQPDYPAIFDNVLEVMAEIASGQRYSTKEDAMKTLHKKFYSKHVVVAG